MSTAHPRPATTLGRRSAARARGRLITTALAATALLVPAAAGTQAASAKGKPGTGTQTACAPGAQKKDSTGVTVAVCNTKGQWVKVLYLTADGGDDATVDQGAAAAPEVAGNPITTAVRADRKSGTSAPTGCPLNDGTTAGFGETMAVVTDYRDASGKLLHRDVSSYICGQDGQWHLVARLAGTANITRVTTVGATDRQVS